MISILWFLFFIQTAWGLNLDSTDASPSEFVQARLVSEVESIHPGASFHVGVMLEMQRGWHTYWLNPGDSGLPTTIVWDLPTDFVAGVIQWPYPERFGTDTIVNFGYEEKVLLIAEIKASQTVKLGETIKISAKVNWLVCKEECLPGQANLTLSLPVKNRASPDPSWSKKFTEARKKLPISSMEWGIRASIDVDEIILRISSPSWYNQDMAQVYFFPEQMELFNYAHPQIFQKTREGYVIRAKISVLAREIPSELRGVLVSDKSWSRTSENKALRIVVPFQQHYEDNKTCLEVSP